MTVVKIAVLIGVAAILFGYVVACAVDWWELEKVRRHYDRDVREQQRKLAQLEARRRRIAESKVVWMNQGGNDAA